MIRIFRAALEFASIAAFISMVLVVSGCTADPHPPTCKAGSAVVLFTNCEVEQ